MHLQDPKQSAYGEAEAAPEAREVGPEVMRLGAFGLVQKSATSATLFAAIDEVVAGRRVFPPFESSGPIAAAAHPPPGFLTLTATQQAIVCLIGKGFSSLEIARQLRRSPWTIHSHRKHIRKTLGLSSDLDMHRFALLAANNFENFEIRGGPSKG